MKQEQYKDYLIDLVFLLKEQAREAKLDADRPKEEIEGYSNGYLMAYHMVISLMKLFVVILILRILFSKNIKNMGFRMLR